MAVLPATVKKHWKGSTGGGTLTGGEQFVAVWRMETDEEQDQAQVVYAYFIANVLALGAAYVYGNDISGTAVLQGVVANRIAPSQYAWEVVATFGERDDEDSEQQDPDGNPSTDPLDWRPRFASGVYLYRGPVQSAVYRGGYQDGWKYDVGDLIAPMSSSLQPFSNPPLEEDKAREWFMIGANVSEVADTETFYGKINSVNSVQFRYDHRNVGRTIPSLMGKIRDVRITPRSFRGTDYVEVDFYIDIAPRADTGWRTQLIDKGTLLRACDSDPDGRGGTIGVLGQGTPFPASTPRLRVPTDLHGEVIGEEFLLDGAGSPLDTCAGDPPWYADWEHYTEADFNTYDVLKDLIN